MSSHRQSVSNSQSQYKYAYHPNEKVQNSRVGKQQKANSQVWRQSSKNGLESRASRPEEAYQNYHQKMKALCKVKYINQLARMQYEEKLTQLHSKHSMRTKQTVLKKMKAKNQIAQFIDEAQEYDEELEQLIEFNHGKNKNKGFFYERQSKQGQYEFCAMCDEVYKESEQEHTNKCEYKVLSRSPSYYSDSLGRMKKVCEKKMGIESDEIKQLIDRIGMSQDVIRELNEVTQLVRNDNILYKICLKLRQIIKQTQY